MMEEYIRAELEIVEFETEDIITTSGCDVQECVDVISCYGDRCLNDGGCTEAG